MRLAPESSFKNGPLAEAQLTIASGRSNGLSQEKQYMLDKILK